MAANLKRDEITVTSARCFASARASSWSYHGRDDPGSTRLILTRPPGDQPMAHVILAMSAAAAQDVAAIKSFRLPRLYLHRTHQPLTTDRPKDAEPPQKG